MARIGVTKDDYEIVIFTDDSGIIPHFHYRDSRTRGREFHTCIKITSNDYFHHGSKQGILNAKQRKELVEFLQSSCRNTRFSSNWEYLLSMRNDNNSNTIVDEFQEMPDYKDMR